jgi:hypothetical protein
MRARTNPYFITGGKLIPEVEQKQEENLDVQEQTIWQHDWSD